MAVSIRTRALIDQFRPGRSRPLAVPAVNPTRSGCRETVGGVRRLPSVCLTEGHGMDFDSAGSGRTQPAVAPGFRRPDGRWLEGGWLRAGRLRGGRPGGRPGAAARPGDPRRGVAVLTFGNRRRSLSGWLVGRSVAG